MGESGHFLTPCGRHYLAPPSLCPQTRLSPFYTPAPWGGTPCSPRPWPWPLEFLTPFRTCPKTDGREIGENPVGPHQVPGPAGCSASFPGPSASPRGEGPCWDQRRCRVCSPPHAAGCPRPFLSSPRSSRARRPRGALEPSQGLTPSGFSVPVCEVSGCSRWKGRRGGGPATSCAAFHRPQFRIAHLSFHS